MEIIPECWIEMIPWAGQYGAGKVTNRMKDEGKLLVLYHLYGATTEENFKKKEKQILLKNVTFQPYNADREKKTRYLV